MTKKRSPEFSLRSALDDPGFSPRPADLGGLAALGAGDDEIAARAAVRAIGRIQSSIAAQAARVLAEADAGGRRALLRGLALRAGGLDADAAGELAVARLGDDDARVRSAAAHALGKLRPEAASLALREALGREPDEHVRKAIVEALGLVGGEGAAEAIREAGVSGVRAERAALMAQRTSARAVGTVTLDVALPGAVTATLACRRGLGVLVADEAARRGASVLRVSPGGERVDVAWPAQRPLAALAEVRTALGLAIVHDEPRAADETDEALVVRALRAPAVDELVRALTRGAARFRLRWAGAGKRRGATWNVALALESRPGLLENDPIDATWEVRAIVHGRGLRLELAPQVEDQRFAYRVAEVPAASHPTIAAALVALGGVREHDVAWDPFVGSGLELCERSLAGPYRQLVGTDIDPVAIERARANVTSLGVRDVELRVDDARGARVPGLTLVVTNPPLGRRVLRGGDLEGLMVRVIDNAASQLARGGRIVIASPAPRATRDAAHRAGLTLAQHLAVDLGGIEVEAQRFER